MDSADDTAGDADDDYDGDDDDDEYDGLRDHDEDDGDGADVTNIPREYCKCEVSPTSFSGHSLAQLRGQ